MKRAYEFFSLHDLLTMAALAALGGLSSAVLSMVRFAVHAVVVLPGAFQFLAGLHVLWLILAIGIIGRPGAATVTALLKGGVEFLSGNPHGLLVLAYTVFAGIAVDATWLMLGRSHNRVTYALAGGFGATSNLLVLTLVVSLPAKGGVVAGLAILVGAAFVSGVVFAGLLAWWLLEVLHRAGVISARSPSGPITSRL
ncbi:MAG: ECF transporter S component [Planctomycetota bacterium]